MHGTRIDNAWVIYPAKDIIPYRCSSIFLSQHKYSTLSLGPLHGGLCEATKQGTLVVCL